MTENILILYLNLIINKININPQSRLRVLLSKCITVVIYLLKSSLIFLHRLLLFRHFCSSIFYILTYFISFGFDILSCFLKVRFGFIRCSINFIFGIFCSIVYLFSCSIDSGFRFSFTPLIFAVSTPNPLSETVVVVVTLPSGFSTVSVLRLIWCMISSMLQSLILIKVFSYVLINF